MGDLKTKILAGLRSPQFFAAILILFFVEAVWIAVSAAYPMVFDENTHFGIIQLYAHQWSPLMLHQPAHSSWAGALPHNPSLLYHYLLSFPYRLIARLTSDQMIQVIDLRFINVLLFGGSLVLFRRLLLKTKVSPAIIHATILFFVLTPVVPLLAGQINYDNLLMLVTAWSLLLTVQVTERLETKQLPVTRIAGLLTVCMLGSLVQYEFLPVFAGIAIWTTWKVWQSKKQLKITKELKNYWQDTSWRPKSLVGLPLLIAAGLFAQIYAVNLAVYHTPVPQCDQVISRQQCADYAPWQRNQTVLAHKGAINRNPVLYAASWSYRMLIAMFFTSSGGASASAFYLSINPLPLIFGAALAVLLIGGLLIIKYRYAVFQGYDYMGFLLFMGLFYTATLMLHNYADYVSLGQKVAIQGRYLFPLILPIMLIIALAFRQLFGHRLHLKMALMCATLLLFMQGGGALTYILNSNENWYWQNRVVVRLNHAAQQIAKPLVVVKTPLRSFGTTKT